MCIGFFGFLIIWVFEFGGEVMYGRIEKLVSLIVCLWVCFEICRVILLYFIWYYIVLEVGKIFYWLV